MQDNEDTEILELPPVIDAAAELERDKLNTEREKLNIEREKLWLERNKLTVSVLIEDFKARWQELLNFEAENSRWQTLYITALILAISWVLSNLGGTGKYKDITEFFSREGSYLLLTLALINAYYTLAMAYKGYQIQEIALYLTEKIVPSVSSTTSAEFTGFQRQNLIF